MQLLQYRNSQLFLHLLLTLNQSSIILSTSRSSFSEFCDKSTRCDSSASLTCQNGTCSCLKPDSMTFDPIRRVCVALAGEKCKFTVVEGYQSWLEEVGCIKNAKCLPSTSLCTCEPTFLEHSNGTCLPRLGFGQRCTVNNETSECRSDLHLTCLDNECKCDPEVAIFSYAQSQCVGLSDKPCLNDLCVTNAICRGFYGGHSVDSYEEYSGEDTKCSCSPGYTTTSKGLCQVGHSGECDFSESQCLDRFKCQEGTCICKFKGHQLYEEEYQDCYSLVGGPCTPPKNSTNDPAPIYCTKPAICVPQGNFRHECVCPEGMVENENRKCELIYNRMCQTDKERGSSRGLKCDQIAPLFCIQGRCQCEDEFKIYDQKFKKCRGLVGSDCLWSDKNNKSDKFCVDGSFCKRFRGSETNGRCECLDSHTEIRNRTCVDIKQE